MEHQNYVNEQHMRQKVAEIADRLKPANLVRNLFSQLIGGANIRIESVEDGGWCGDQFDREKIFQERYHAVRAGGDFFLILFS